MLEDNGAILQTHNIIYRLAEDVRSLINLRLPPLDVEEIIGMIIIHALMLQVDHDSHFLNRQALCMIRCI